SQHRCALAFFSAQVRPDLLLSTGTHASDSARSRLPAQATAPAATSLRKRQRPQPPPCASDSARSRLPAQATAPAATSLRKRQRPQPPPCASDSARSHLPAQDSRFNFGLYMLQPSRERFWDMMQWVNGSKAEETAGGVIGVRYNDYTEQNFVQFYFSGHDESTSSLKTWTRIKYNFMLKHLRYMMDGCLRGSHGTHFAGSPKPWTTTWQCPYTSKFKHSLFPMWWKVYNKMSGRSIAATESAKFKLLPEHDPAGIWSPKESAAVPAPPSIDKETLLKGVLDYGVGRFAKTSQCLFEGAYTASSLQSVWNTKYSKTSVGQNILRRRSSSLQRNRKCIAKDNQMGTL
ncbi:hypothetical protein CYMTET_55713, partial [Cymbomonas tetramitiformis]